MTHVCYMLSFLHRFGLHLKGTGPIRDRDVYKLLKMLQMMEPNSSRMFTMPQAKFTPTPTQKSHVRAKEDKLETPLPKCFLYPGQVFSLHQLRK